MNGKINQSVGHPKVMDGVIRRLSIRDRLNQIAMSRQSGVLLHPMLGSLEVTSSRAQQLLDMYSEEHLIRLKRLLFEPAGENRGIN